jgi:hypothetical protein
VGVVDHETLNPHRRRSTDLGELGPGRSLHVDDDAFPFTFVSDADGKLFGTDDSRGEWDSFFNTYYSRTNTARTTWDDPDDRPNLVDLKRDELVVAGVPFVSPRRLLEEKRRKARPTDLADITLLERQVSE